MKKVPPISLKLNFTPNTLGSYGRYVSYFIAERSDGIVRHESLNRMFSKVVLANE